MIALKMVTLSIYLDDLRFLMGNLELTNTGIIYIEI